MILSLKEISKSFGGTKALSPLNFGIKKGEIFALIGPNGAGKTTLFNIISGNLKPSSGEVIFKDKNITALKPHKIVHLGIARTFQNIRLFKSLSVLENVLIGLDKSINYNLLEAFLHLGRFKKSEKEAKFRAEALLKELGILDLAHKKATSLSYGQQRKVEIARALATKPNLLLLDEPAAGMNASESEELAELILRLKKEYELSILLIEHDMSFIHRLCDRVLVLDYGRVIFEGDIKEAMQDEAVIKAYLGDFKAGEKDAFS